MNKDTRSLWPSYTVSHVAQRRPDTLKTRERCDVTWLQFFPSPRVHKGGGRGKKKGRGKGTISTCTFSVACMCILAFAVDTMTLGRVSKKYRWLGATDVHVHQVIRWRMARPRSFSFFCEYVKIFSAAPDAPMWCLSRPDNRSLVAPACLKKSFDSSNKKKIQLSS